ncbi:chymotrypsin-like protease CTRL-1 [Lepeophtheirus salmonis]|uniref:chymotrypsin-like protease CTRL-1 n=1 Tax=Lepeophtheirus salmonis TaxID=72036 RepID=UPI001AEA9F45|nr:tissue-type plasminogen activator-like [Lepeophtheirus salmonis]
MKLIISWICILSVTSAAYGEKECRTSSGKCEFPFVYSGTHSICTQSGSKDEPRPWCYQGSDSDSKWDYCPENCFECGVSNNITISCNKQWQGEEGDLENDAFPWHVFIVGRAEQEKLCNGIILTHNRLLTTANCAQYYHSKVIDVYAGSGGRFPSNGYQAVSIQKYIQHENYNMTTRENNIAIIFLNNNLVWNDKVLPICFSSDNFPVEEGKKATFTGSNIVQNDYEISRIHYSIVKTVPDYLDKVCKNEGFLCTTRNSVRDDHNEGGPLTVCQNSTRCVVVGILSYIKSHRNILVFTNISMHIDWINKYI